MAKKKKQPKKKQSKKKEPILTEEEKDEKKLEGELPKKKIRLTENRQLIGFIVVIIIFFAAFLGPYFFIQNQKSFEYAGVTWQIEEHGEETLYHTRFEKFYKNTFHNTFLRNDPRKNNIPIEVKGFSLQPNIIIALTPEVTKCYKQILVSDALSQIMLAVPFLKTSTIAITNEEVAKEAGKYYATCDNKPARSTVIQLELGDESKVTEDRENNCIFITIEKCEDNIITAEKLIIEMIRQLNG